MSLSYAIEMQKMFEEDNTTLKERESLLKGDISKEPSEALRPVWKSSSGLWESMQTLAVNFRRLELESKNVEEMESELKNANQVIQSQKATLDSISRKKPGGNESGAIPVASSRDALEDFLSKLVRKKLSLAESLKMISDLYPERLVILNSAIESAADSESFLYPEQAFELLLRLATDYWKTLGNQGDAEARKLFGKSYSAKEKSTLTKQGVERRTFDFRGQPMRMDKHLKIGTADNAADTLRIHFEWVAEEQIIVTGHCGKHLDF